MSAMIAKSLETTSPPLALRSQDGGWNRTRWEQLPADGNRYEVIDGILYTSTAPSVFHQWIVQRLFLALHRQIDVTGSGTTFVSPVGVFMPGCDPVQPDVLVVRAEDAAFFREGRIFGVPALLVEVQSPSNPSYDDQTKRRAYARAAVPEFWMARPRFRDLMVCSRPDAALGDFAESHIVAAGQEIVSPTLPVRVAVDELFAGAPDTTL